jgi:hypothetical protein
MDDEVTRFIAPSFDVTLLLISHILTTKIMQDAAEVRSAST